MSDVDRHIAQILDALDCEPRGAWMPSESLVRAFIDEIYRLRKQLAEARNKALESAAIKAEGAAFMSYPPHEHPKRIAEDIRNLKANPDGGT